MNRGPPHQGKFPETEALNCSAWILTTAMMSSTSPPSSAPSRDFRGNDLNPDLVSSTGLEWAHPIVGEWFVNKFGTPTEPQQQGLAAHPGGGSHSHLGAYRFGEKA